MIREENPDTDPADDEPGSPLLSLRQHRPHDFQKPRLVSDEKLRTLDVIHRKFARTAAAGLSALVRSRVQVELLGIAQKSYFDFIRSLPNPTSLYLVYGLPQRLPLVLEISPAVLFPMIERLLGGKGDDASSPARPLTRIEQELAKSVAAEILSGLEEAWACAAPSSTPSSMSLESSENEPGGTRFDIAEVEHNPLLMQIVGPAEPSVVLSFQVTLGATATRMGPFHLCLPAKPFEATLAKLCRSASRGSETERNTSDEKEKILNRLSSTTLELSAELASVPVALPDLLGLRPGDVIDTQVSRTAEIALLADGRRAFSGRPATRDGRRALKITRCEGEG